MAQSTTREELKVTLRPLGDRVLVRRLEPEEKLKGGIILPDTAKKKQERAEVLAIGAGKKDKNGQIVPMPVNVGDHILMDKYSGQEIELDGLSMIIVRASDIVAIIEK